MKTIKTVFVTLVIIAVLAPVTALGVIYSGVYNVAATQKHWPPVSWLLNKTVHNSIKARAGDIDVPELGSREQMYTGINNYQAMCAGCHAPPGAEPTALAQGLYPEPPNLAHTAGHHSAAYMFRAIKYGIKASGMPAWGPTHSDDDLWSLVALITQFPYMDGADYVTLRQEAQDKGSGHHSSGGGHNVRSHADSKNHSPEASSHHEQTTSGSDGHAGHTH